MLLTNIQKKEKLKIISDIIFAINHSSNMKNKGCLYDSQNSMEANSEKIMFIDSIFAEKSWIGVQP